MKKIIAFSGSNSSQSINQALINDLAKTINAEQQAATIKVIDIRDYPLPIYSQDIERESGHPAAVKELQAVLFEHDALLIASPEHNGSIPAVFKNTIDWLSRLVKPGKPFFGEEKKPVFLLSASPGAKGGATNLESIAKLMSRWGGDVKGQFSIGKFNTHFGEAGLDEATRAELLPALRQFIEQL